MRPLLVGLLLVPLAAAQFSQTMSSLSASGGPDGWTVRIGPPPPFGLLSRTGAPYSATESMESVQRLPDGGTIRRSMPEVKTWRDSAGRLRTERPVAMAPLRPGMPPSPVLIEILDPVGRSRYVLDPEQRLAHRHELPEWKQGSPGPRPAAPPAGSFSTTPAAPPSATGAPARPEVKTKFLGQQTIEGVLVDGTQQTMTWAPGTMGNDTPLVSVNENWFSPELGLPVLTKTTDPRSGEHTRRLTNISRAEPSADLFQPPSGWTVVEERGDFTIRFAPKP